jgi:DNA processing protein
MTEDRPYWLAWSSIPGIGPVLLKRVYQHFGSVKTAWSAPGNAIAAVDGFGPKLVEKVREGRLAIDPETLLSEHLLKNPHFWTPADPDYPRLLLEIPSPPPVLYYRGQVDPLENQGQVPTIAIVGTRQPSEHGQRWTKRLSTLLAKQGFTIVSGMAEGVDGIAHQSCLQTGGRTIAVLGTGVDMVYPPHHRQLHAEIRRQGLILSEYPSGTQPNKAFFPARNRIIAGLSRATIVIEAPEKSGSLITARYANEFGGDIYAIPNSPEVSSARGCLQLIRQGAEMILSEEELLEMLGALPNMDSPSSPVAEKSPDIAPRLGNIYRLLSEEAIAFDSIVQAAGIPSPDVAGILLELELMGLVTQLPGTRYRKQNH